jgi:hypothetical protein
MEKDSGQAGMTEVMLCAHGASQLLKSNVTAHQSIFLFIVALEKSTSVRGELVEPWTGFSVKYVVLSPFDRLRANGRCSIAGYII